MGLPVIRYAGISVYSSDLIADDENHIYMMGIAGYQTAVRGIIANFLERRSVNFIGSSQYEYYQRSPENYSIRYLKLPSGLYQCLILSVIGLPDYKESDKESDTESDKRFLIIGEDMPSVKKLFYRQLDEKTETPIHPDWTEWLWNAFIEKEWLKQLQTKTGSLKGFLAYINESGLQDAVTEAVACQIPEMMRCFEKGEPYVSQSERISG